MNSPHSILFIGAHRPGRSPGQRFRYEQFVPFLEANGFECELSYILDEEDDKVIYAEGKYLSKIGIAAKGFIKRTRDMMNSKHFDIIFIYREAFMTGNTLFERQMKKSGAKIIFDFDDAIWLYDISEGNRRFGWLKKPEKTADIIGLADLVFAGNNFLAQYALQHNKNVKIVPTVIDTNYHKRSSPVGLKQKVCIGWTGSHTTIKHFEFGLNFLYKIKEKYGEKVYFKLIGDPTFKNAELNLNGIAWKKESEIHDLNEIDIGIMPLPNDEWSMGKCGFKGIQYMALEIPCIMSPVGVNIEIIQDGVNGFLSASEDVWVEKLSALIESPALRSSIGKAGRETVIQKYSVDSLKTRYLSYFKELVGEI